LNLEKRRVAEETAGVKEDTATTTRQAEQVNLSRETQEFLFEATETMKQLFTDIENQIELVRPTEGGQIRIAGDEATAEFETILNNLEKQKQVIDSFNAMALDSASSIQEGAEAAGISLEGIDFEDAGQVTALKELVVQYRNMTVAQDEAVTAGIKAAKERIKMERRLSEAQKRMEIEYFKQYGNRLTEISGRLGHGFISRKTSNILKEEELTLEQQRDRGSRIREEADIVRSQLPGLSNAEVEAEARARVAAQEQQEQLNLRTTLDTWKNFFKDEVETTFEDLLTIDIVGAIRGDNGKQIGEQLLNILTDALTRLQGRLAEHAGDWLSETLFGQKQDNASIGRTESTRNIGGGIYDTLFGEGQREQPITPYFDPSADLFEGYQQLPEFDLGMEGKERGSSAADSYLGGFSDGFEGTIDKGGQGGEGLSGIFSKGIFGAEGGFTNQNMAGMAGGAAIAGTGAATGNTEAILGGIGMIAGTALGGTAGGAIGGALGGLIGSFFAKGGEVGKETEQPMGLKEALEKEQRVSGKEPILGVLHKGEEVLSTLNGDAAAFRSIQKSGVWDTMKNNMFALGGTVGSSRLNNPTTSHRNQNSQVVNNSKTVFNVVATSDEVVQRTSRQMEARKRRLFL